MNFTKANLGVPGGTRKYFLTLFTSLSARFFFAKIIQERRVEELCGGE